MPWAHCGHDGLLDTDPCPACGIDKAQWTVEFEVTRTFQVKRSSGLRLSVVDALDRPLAGRRFRVERAGQPPVEGELDAEGGARVPGAGEARVTFVDLRAGDLAPHDVDAPGWTVEGQTFVVPAGRALRLRRRPLHSARWSATRVRFDQGLKLIVEADGLEEGTEVTFEVLEHDADGQHDHVARLFAPLRGGRAAFGWHMPYVADLDDAPTEVDRETGFDLPEYLFVARAGDHEARCDDLLMFAADLELPLKDEDGTALAEVEYELRCAGKRRRGRTDAQGVLREPGVGPSFTLALADGRELVVRCEATA